MADSSILFDIQAEIIKRVLEVKSVIRFRSVSKTWKSFIDSPWFIRYHHTQHHHHRRHLLVTYSDVDAAEDASSSRYSHTFRSKQKYVSMVDDDSFQVSLLTEISISKNMLRATDVRGLKTISSSHGLVCVYKRKAATAVIWNPLIRKSIRIHVPNDDENNTGGVVGFGVCPGTLEPKLVKITWNNRDFTLPWQVKVYSLSSPRFWRSINHNLPPHNLSRFRLRFDFEHVVVDHGFIYWLSTYFDDEFQRERNMIISFNVTTEEFTQVYLPDCLADHVRTSPFRYGLDISTRMDSLVLIQYNGESWRERTAGIWKMEEHSGVFTKLFNICIRADEGALCGVRGFRDNGEPVINFGRQLKRHGPYKYGLYAYEPSSGRIKFTGIDIEQNESIHYVGSYMETLLLLGRQDYKFDQQKLSTEIIVTWEGVELENKKPSIRPARYRG